MTKPRVFAPAILSGLLLWMAFYPFNLGILAFGALVPFLALVRMDGVSRSRRYFAAYVGGLAFFVPALQWIRVAHPMMYASWFFLALSQATYFPIALALLRRFDTLKWFPFPLSVAIVWVALEYVRAHFPTGFPFLRPLGLHQFVGFAWYYLGHTMHEFLPMIQVADLGGVWLISFMIAALNGMLAEWLFRSKILRGWLRWPVEHRIGFNREMWSAAIAILLVLLTYGYGMFRLKHDAFEAGPLVSAIQADFAQDEKMGDPDSLFREYNRLCESVALRRPKPDLIIWPETCYSPEYTVNRAKPGTVAPEAIRNGLRDNADLERFAFDRWRTNVLLGTSLDEWDGERTWKYNSAVLVNPDGTFNNRYDKIHLVPFGEYVPFKSTFPWLQSFTPYRHDYSCRPGEKLTRFAFMRGNRQFTFGVLICYEDSEPYLARQYNLPAGDERPVDFLVNISNDGWFRGSEEHEQHLAICKFRAVEARRSVVRAVNMGISAIIDSDGRIQALPHNTPKESLHHVGPVTDTIQLDRRESIYAQTGDWPAAVCWGLIALVLVFTRRRS